MVFMANGLAIQCRGQSCRKCELQSRQGQESTTSWCLLILTLKFEDIPLKLDVSLNSDEFLMPVRRVFHT